ncbi:hypothetical protein [Caldibacillus thermoamylovorans]|uniref:hypothetical protein n=1 Tax=Caldibacillus thermoamylovorans TaxID=35841 RepID=UPI00203F5958|nr:hypothetical protein [Caldibacillus thermoamylovorans]MCM3054250.1 hypothetical protein [Caldibacillus thermoamylovorans]
MSFLNPKIDENEFLYRAIKKSIPNRWDIEKNRPSSALFKESKGVSVDRDGNRNKREIVTSFLERFGHTELKAIVNIRAGRCYEKDCSILYRPLDDNPFHAEIHNGNGKVELTKGQARFLAKNCTIVEQYDL